MDNQCNQILSYLKTGRSITPIDALELFGCFRLGARIYDLRGRGIHIADQFVETRSGKRVKEYWIDG